MDIDVNKFVSEIKFPESNIYFEKVSADGYAFLGFARTKCNLNYNNCLNKIIENKFSLNSNHSIKGINVTKNNKYVYTMWTCCEFLYQIGKKDLILSLGKEIDKIGTYDNGMYRYCLEEVFYLVPNVTTAAALIFSYNGEFEKTKNIIKSLYNYDREHGLQYFFLNSLLKLDRLGQKEDAYHLAMMAYHLVTIEKISKINTRNLYLKIIEDLEKINVRRISPGTIGWGYPMLYAATKGSNVELEKRSLSATLKCGIHNANFRTRAMSAWALTL
jgi:hypothetical protein